MTRLQKRVDLKPKIHMKVNELFDNWLNCPGVREQLLINLERIKLGDHIIPFQQSTNFSQSISSKNRCPSPRNRIASSLPTPVRNNSPTPRSPRKAVNSSERHEQRNSFQNEPNISYQQPQPLIQPTQQHRQNSTDKFIHEKESKLIERNKKIKSENIPAFYFPLGRNRLSEKEISDIIIKLTDYFSQLPSGQAKKQHIPGILKICGLPLYWKSLIFQAAGGNRNNTISLKVILALVKNLFEKCHDEALRFMFLTSKPGANVLCPEDFKTLIQDVIETHPGLNFLKSEEDFHVKYVLTVIARIFYSVNRSWSGKINVHELRKSNFLQTLRLLEEESDINRITDYFSYEHFYVIYCKFWELDNDHDMYISKQELARHNNDSISLKMIERIFSGTVMRDSQNMKNRMSYYDFVWFLLSEEDKRNITAIEYWFRCMDLDGDGSISMYEMQYFYEEQVTKMEQLGFETLPFEDCLCQMLDMIKPANLNYITLADLKACKQTPIFFDTFFNLEKYLEHEQRDPFSNIQDLENGEPPQTDWEKYAAEEYEILVSEEGGDVDQNLYDEELEPHSSKSIKSTNSLEDF